MKLLLVALLVFGAISFVGLMSWQIQRGKTGWVLFDGIAAELYLSAAFYFAMP